MMKGWKFNGFPVREAVLGRKPRVRGRKANNLPKGPKQTSRRPGLQLVYMIRDPCAALIIPPGKVTPLIFSSSSRFF